MKYILIAALLTLSSLTFAKDTASVNSTQTLKLPGSAIFLSELESVSTRGRANLEPGRSCPAGSSYKCLIFDISKAGLTKYEVDYSHDDTPF